MADEEEKPEKLPKLGDNRTILLLLIIAASIPLSVVTHGVSYSGLEKTCRRARSSASSTPLAFR